MVLECRKILVRQILNFREGRKNRLLKRFTLQSTSELNIAVVCCQNCWMLFQYGKRFFLFFILFFYILGAFLIKQLFHSRLLDMRWQIANAQLLIISILYVSPHLNPNTSPEQNKIKQKYIYYYRYSNK